MYSSDVNSLIVVGVVILISFLKWVFQEVSKHAEKRRQQQARERQHLESLRTGRVDATIAENHPTSHSAASEAERREELAELRRRAAARRAANPDPPANKPPELPRALEILLGLPPGTTTGGTISPTPAPASRKSRPKSRDRSRDKSRALKPQRPQATGSQPDPEVEAQRRAQIRRDADEENAAAEFRRQQVSSERHREQERARIVANRAQGIDQRLLRDAKPLSTQPGEFVPKNAAEWRRTIAMNEVLGKPVSLR